MWLRRLWRVIRRSAFRRSQDDREIEEELRFHLAQEIQLRIDRGAAPEAAERSTHLALRSLTLVKEDTRAVWVATWLEQTWQDVRTGCRIVTTAPLLTVTAVALVALVIGGNTTVFSMAHAILHGPAPGVRASSLVTLSWSRADGGFDPGVKYSRYEEIARQSRTLQPLLAVEWQRFALGHREAGTHAVWGALVTADHFATLDVPLALGRTFTVPESRGSAAGLTALISHRAWQEFFEAGQDVIGTPILLNGHHATVIGVVADPFRGAILAPPVDVWVPMLSYLQIHRGSPADLAFVSIIGRLAPGRSITEARAELGTIWQRVGAVDADARHISPVVLRYSATAGGNSVVATRGSMFLAVFAVVTFVTLTIVCANVANLLIGRATIRQRELALRQSLGASRLRILRMLLAEAALISALAWGASCLFAWWMSRALGAWWAPSASGGLPRLLSLTPDWTVVGYALLLAAVATAIITVAPTVRVCRLPLLPFLKSGEQGVVRGRSRLSSALVVVQLGLSVVLLTSAGLAYRSLSLLSARDLGFDPRPLLLVTINTAGAATNRAAGSALVEQIRQRLQATPGVESVSQAASPLRERWSTILVSSIPGMPEVRAEYNHVGPGYLQVHGLDPVAGRELDRPQRSGPLSALINRTLADTLWPGESPVGHRLHTSLEFPRNEVEVVGLTPDAFFGGYRHSPRPSYLFLSELQDPHEPGETTLYIRHAGSPDAIGASVRRVIHDVHPGIPIVQQRPLTLQLENVIWPVRMLTMLLALFAGGALLIAAIGQYAVVAFDTRRRTRELGVHMALGASSAQVMGAVFRDGLRLTLLGLAIGLGLSIAVGHAMRGLLYGVTPTDAVTYAGVLALLAGCSLLACLLPAYQAARLDPVRVLRFE